MIQNRLANRFMIVALSAFVILAVVGVRSQLLAADQPSASSNAPPERSDAVQSAENLSAAFRAAGQSVRPAVIGIYSLKPGPLPAVSRLPSALDSIGNDAFVSLAYPLTGDPTGDAVVEEFLGSGVIVGADGTAVTSHKVVEGAKRVRVRTADKQEYSAKIVQSDAQTGLAIIKIEGGKFPVAPVASSAAKVGDWVVAVGVLPGGENSLSVGVISARNRRPENRELPRDLLLTDAVVDDQNDGGALVNLKGEVVGINTLTDSSQDRVARFSFAVPMDAAQSMIGSHITTNSSRKVEAAANQGAFVRSRITSGIPAAWRDVADRLNTLLTSMPARLGVQDLPRSWLKDIDRHSTQAPVVHKASKEQATH